MSMVADELLRLRERVAELEKRLIDELNASEYLRQQVHKAETRSAAMSFYLLVLFAVIGVANVALLARSYFVG